jgi:hypothetical protein
MGGWGWRWTGDGLNCIDMDECATLPGPCITKTPSVPTPPGSFKCACKSGWSSNHRLQENEAFGRMLQGVSYNVIHTMSLPSISANLMMNCSFTSKSSHQMRYSAIELTSRNCFPEEQYNWWCGRKLSPHVLLWWELPCPMHSPDYIGMAVNAGTGKSFLSLNKTTLTPFVWNHTLTGMGSYRQSNRSI